MNSKPLHLLHFPLVENTEIFLLVSDEFCLEKSSSIQISIYQISWSHDKDYEKITVFWDGTLCKLV
jgi:hypothetical protein